MLQPSSVPFAGQASPRPVTLSSAVSNVFNNYATFSGRASRAEYWWWVLFYLAVSSVLAFIDTAVIGSHSFSPLSTVWSLTTIIPALAVGVRRLHDVGRSGWWLLISMVPLVGIILLLVWNCTRGEAGPNRYGSDPLGFIN